LEPDGPAAKAGIGSGDIITSVDGQALKDDRDLTKRIGEIAPGTQTRLSVVHRGQENTITLALGEMPESAGGRGSQARAAPPPSGPASLGLAFAAADKVDGSGVVVTEVDPGGTGAQRGFEVGDIILDIGTNAVKTPADVQKALAQARERGTRFAVARVKSGDTTSFVAIPLS
jgi:serine protease Do